MAGQDRTGTTGGLYTFQAQPLLPEESVGMKTYQKAAMQGQGTLQDWLRMTDCGVVQKKGLQITVRIKIGGCQ